MKDTECGYKKATKINRQIYRMPIKGPQKGKNHCLVYSPWTIKGD